MARLIERVNGWAEAVFHVLAHVRATAHLAASAYDADYVAAIALQLGPAARRALRDDAALLGHLLSTHDALAAAQVLAWLFRSPARAAAASGLDLADLAPDQVDAPALLPALARGGPAVEILRAAAELEAPLLAALPPPEVDLGALAGALARAAPAAPHLEACAVGVLRPLGWRGRVWGREIWVGPAPLDHAAWQAAHEATVSEVAAEMRGRGEAPAHGPVEREALARMAARARAAGLTEEHRAWLQRIDRSALG